MNKDKIIKDLKEINDKLVNQRRQFELRFYHEQYLVEEKYKEIEILKKDLINLLRIIDKNCDDLEGTEEEFDSLDRTENLLKGSE